MLKLPRNALAYTSLPLLTMKNLIIRNLFQALQIQPNRANDLPWQTNFPPDISSSKSTKESYLWRRSFGSVLDILTMGSSVEDILTLRSSVADTIELLDFSQKLENSSGTIKI